MIELVLGFVLVGLGAVALSPRVMKWYGDVVLAQNWRIAKALGWRYTERQRALTMRIHRVGVPAMLMLTGAAMVVGGLKDLTWD